jgi:MFS family permease
MKDTTYSNFRWYILLTMIVVTVTTAMSMIAPAAVFSVLFRSMPGLDPGQVVQAAMTVFSFSLGLAALFGGFLLDRFGPIKVFIGGLVLVMAGAVLMPVMGSTFWGMVCIRLLQGMGTGPVMAAAAPIAASYFPLEERSIAAGAQGFAVSFGIIIGLQIVPRLASSPDNVFWALGIIAPVAVVGLLLSIIALFRPETGRVLSVTGFNGNDTVDPLFKEALRNPMTWIAIACFMLMSGIYNQLNNIVEPYISSEPPLGLGMGRAAGANALTYATVVFCIGSFVSGVITDKLFRGSVRPVIATGFLLGAVFSFSIRYEAITSNYGLLVLFLMLTGFFFSWVNPQTQSYLAKNFAREITGRLGGLSMFVGICLGSTAAIWSVGKSLSVTGSYLQPLNIMAGLCLVGFIVSLFLKQHPKG